MVIQHREIGEALTRWTVRGAFALYVLTVSLNLRVPGAQKLARWLWTAGCVLLIVHVGLAFEVFHHGSHTEAYKETARQTAAVTGISSGGGLYFNYVMLVVWLIDTVWWWGNRQNHATRKPGLTWGFQFFFAFMWFNATVVFGHGLIRWAGVAAFAMLAVFWRQTRRVKTT